MKNGISVIIGANTNEKIKTSKIIQRLCNLKNITEIYEVTGPLDLIMFAQSDSISAINSLIESVRTCEGIKKATTHLVLEKTQNK